MAPEPASPLITVAIPVYNGSDFLARAIASALAQTYPRVEVLVVNDGSNDGGATRETALAFGDRIRYIEKPNGGVASALNTAITNMRGDYLAWLSHDDEFLPDKLTKQVDFLRKRDDRENVVLFGGFLVENLMTGENYAAPLFSAEEMARSGLYRWLKAICASQLHGCTTLLPKAVIDRHGVFDEALKTTQDYDYFCRLLAGGVVFAYQEEHLILTRHHKDQGTHALMGVHLRELDALFVSIVDRFRAELTSYRLLFLNEFLRILRIRGQYRALVHLFNAWCEAQAPKDAQPLWLYWECAPGTTMPEYILLCWCTVALHCSRDLRVIGVTPDTLGEYLPHIDYCYQDLDSIAHRADFIRFNLLAEHGGIWLDSDTVVFRSLAPVLDEIAETGFAAMGYRTAEGPGFFPSISFLAAEPKNHIVAEMVERMRVGIVAKLGQGAQPEWDELGGYLLRDIMASAPEGFTFLSAVEYFTFMPYWCESVWWLERKSFGSVQGKLHPGMYCQTLTNSRDMDQLRGLTEDQILRGDHLFAQLFRAAFMEMPVAGGSSEALERSVYTGSTLKLIVVEAFASVSRYGRAALSPGAWRRLVRRTLGRSRREMSR